MGHKQRSEVKFLSPDGIRLTCFTAEPGGVGGRVARASLGLSG